MTWGSLVKDSLGAKGLAWRLDILQDSIEASVTIIGGGASEKLGSCTYPHSYSDHYPLLLELQPGSGMRLGCRPFKFQAAWLRQKDFHKWMVREWEYEGDITKALKKFSMKLAAWSKDTFENIFQRKK